MAKYTSIKDMFDGGGAGQSGAKFEGGGILSAAANAVTRPAGSRERGDADMRTGIGGFARDAFNGGGWGRSGDTFQGGPYGGAIGGLLNMAGVRPMGYADRLAGSEQAMRDAMAGVANYQAPTFNAPPAQPAPMGAPVQPVTVSSLDDIQSLRAELMRMGILPNPANRVMESGPREYSAGGNVAPMFFNNTPGYLR